jgi:hypothetical protein
MPFAAHARRHGALELHRDRPPHLLAADLRRAFSGIVAGNVKEDGMRAIEQHGPFEHRRRTRHHACARRPAAGFVAQNRMKMSGEYRPCYEVVA